LCQCQTYSAIGACNDDIYCHDQSSWSSLNA
jgi:hypothetical protein